jgi:predicted component of type VI protein secretion system
MAESIQHKLDRVRPPRVQITYDVQIGDAFEIKELPLVVGVLADLSGNVPSEVPTKLGDRQFVEIDRDSFREIFAKTNPKLKLTGIQDRMRPKTADGNYEVLAPVEIEGDVPRLDSTDPLDALLANLVSDDPLYMFNPLWIIRNSPELKTLYEARGRLSDLLSKLDGNDELAQQLKALTRGAPATLALDAGSYPKPGTSANGKLPDTVKDADTK